MWDPFRVSLGHPPSGRVCSVHVTDVFQHKGRCAIGTPRVEKYVLDGSLYGGLVLSHWKVNIEVIVGGRWRNGVSG